MLDCGLIVVVAVCTLKTQVVCRVDQNGLLDIAIFSQNQLKRNNQMELIGGIYFSRLSDLKST